MKDEDRIGAGGRIIGRHGWTGCHLDASRGCGRLGRVQRLAPAHGQDDAGVAGARRFGHARRFSTRRFPGKRRLLDRDACAGQAGQQGLAHNGPHLCIPQHQRAAAQWPDQPAGFLQEIPSLHITPWRNKNPVHPRLLVQPEPVQFKPVLIMHVLTDREKPSAGKILSLFSGRRPVTAI